MFAYIDPGTGSMLFTILVGLLGAGVYALRGLALKLRFLASAGGQTKTDKHRIPLVIYGESKRYWNLFGPVCRELEKRGQKTVYLTQSPNDPCLSESFEHIDCRFIGEGNKGIAKLNLLKADVLLATTPNLDVFQWKRSQDVKTYVHILHAVTDPTGYRMFALDHYDTILFSGEYQIAQCRQLEQLRNLPAKDLRIVGVPYMDALKARLDAAKQHDDGHLQRPATLPISQHTVLLAPSWGPNGILKKYGEEIFEALLKTGYHLIIRPHPQSYISELPMLEHLQKKYPESDRIEWNRDSDNFDVLNRSDILISDFSGVIFDFALIFDKPIIFADTAYDTGVYDAAWLDDELWMFKVLPTIGRKLDPSEFGNLKTLIDTCLTDKQFRQGREQARTSSWAHIGQSTNLTVDVLQQLLVQARTKKN